MTVGLTDHIYRHRNRFAGIGTLVLAALYGIAAANLSISDELPKKQPEPIRLTLQDVPPPPTPEPVPPPPPPKPVPQPPKPVPQPTVPHVAPAPIPSPVVVPPPTPEPPKPVTPAEPPPPPQQPPVKTPPPAPAPVVPVSNPQAEGDYTAGARKQIDRNKHYPEDALEMNMSGAVVVAYTLDRDGHLLRAEVEKSSGYSLLDRAALQAVKKTKFKPMPADAWINLKEQVFRTRIEFTIE